MSFSLQLHNNNNAKGRASRKLESSLALRNDLKLELGEILITLD